MPFKLNMSDVKGVPDPGMYVLQLEDIRYVEKKTEAGENSDYLNCRWRIMEPENWVGAPPVWSIHSLTPQSRYFLKNWLEALTGQEWADDDMELDENELVGLFINATLVHDEYKGQVRAKVKDWFPNN
jgi:hypothetical protein